MSWDKNIYDDPEKFGLQIIGEVEFSDGCYQFDTSVVWQDLDTGILYVGDDAGCSCPIPFESTTRSDLRRIERSQDLIDYFDERKASSYYYDSTDGGYYADEASRIDGAVGELILRARAAAKP